MSTPASPNFPLIINIESENQRPEDSEWQGECHHLFTQLRNTLDDGTLEPLKLRAGSETYRGDLVGCLLQFTAGIASIGGLSVIIDMLKLWLERRKNVDVTLKFPDGTK